MSRSLEVDDRTWRAYLYGKLSMSSETKQEKGLCLDRTQTLEGIGSCRALPRRDRDALAVTDKTHKLLSRLFFLKRSGEVACRGDRVLLLYPSHLHTHMLRFDDNHDSERIECALDAFLDLGRETLLYLKPACKDVYDAWELAQACDILIGNVCDMCLSEKGQDVMFAHRIEVNVLDDNHLFVVFSEHRRAKHRSRILSITLSEEPHGLSHPLGGLDKSLSGCVLAQQVYAGLVVRS